MVGGFDFFGGEGMRWSYLAGVAALALSACSPDASPESPVRLDEPGLMTAAGKQPEREYPLDDGRGLQFSPKDQPGFALEFRTGRTNVAWMPSDETTAMASRVLGYAIGEVNATKVISSDTPVQFDQSGYVVSVSPGSMQTLVTIKAK